MKPIEFPKNDYIKFSNQEFFHIGYCSDILGCQFAYSLK